MLYTLVPELYVHQINKLGYEDKIRFKKPRISYQRADGETLEVDSVFNEGARIIQEEDLLMEKSMQMEMYLLEQTSDVFHMYYDKMKKEIHDGGHASLETYVMQLEVMDDVNRKDWEKRLWAEMTELRMINADVKAL